MQNEFIRKISNVAGVLKRFEVVGVALSFIGIVFLVFGKAVVPPPGQMLFGDDIHRAYYFFREFMNTWIQKGIIPWWNPYLFGGEPFIAHPISNMWYPLNWMFLFIPLNIAYSWHMMFHIFWAGLGMFLLLRKEKSIPFLGAWIGAVVFGFSGFFVVRIFAGHVDVIAAASWMPWVVGAFMDIGRSRTSKKYIIVAAVLFALQLLAGYQTMAFFTVIVVGIMTVVFCIVNKSVFLIYRAAIAGIAGVGLAAMQIIPEQEFMRLSVRTYALPYSWVAFGTWVKESALLLINPFYFGNQYNYHGPAPNILEQSVFLGIGGLLLSCFGVVWLFSRRGRSSTVMPFSGIAITFFITFVFGLWVSFGPTAPIDLQYILWKYVPMYSYLRIPPRHLILVAFGLSGLAGFGYMYVVKMFRIGKIIQGFLIAGIVTELVLFGRSFIELRAVPPIRHDPSLVKLLQRDAQPYRMLQNFGVWRYEKDVLDFDSAVSYGIFSATGYDSSMLRSYHEYMAKAAGIDGVTSMMMHDVQGPILPFTAHEVIDKTNIKYIITPIDEDRYGTDSRYTLLWNDIGHNYRVYENTTVKPRFYFSDNSSTASVTGYTPNVITLSVHNNAMQKLYSSEVYYPGWDAYIDGKRTDVQVQDGVFRMITVPPGKHTITYQFTPRIVYFGMAVSALTALVLLFWSKQKRHGSIRPL
jgi:hypothetical protein